MGKIIVGIRGSKLARAQLDQCLVCLESCGLSSNWEIRTITTKADQDKTTPLEEQGPGVFIKELENELIRGTIDCAVHSCIVHLVPSIATAADPVRQRSSSVGQDCRAIQSRR